MDILPESTDLRDYPCFPWSYAQFLSASNVVADWCIKPLFNCMNLIGLLESKHKLLFLFDNLFRGDHRFIMPLFGYRHLLLVRFIDYLISSLRKIGYFFLSCDRHPPSFVGFGSNRKCLSDFGLRRYCFLQVNAELAFDRLY